jgi:hypothetical protein
LANRQSLVVEKPWIAEAARPIVTAEPNARLAARLELSSLAAPNVARPARPVRTVSLTGARRLDVQSK